MHRMSPTITIPKSMNLVHDFGGSDHGKNKARMAFASTKGPIRVDYLFSDHVSHAVGNIINNFAKNVSNYLTPDVKRAFDQLRQAFTKAFILQHFNLKRYIRVETDASGHVTGKVLSQLTNDSGPWYPIAYFLHKMISTKTWYKTHNGELLAIVEAFKIWRHYLKSCKHKVFVLTNHNKLCYFIDIKSLSSRQVRWAQELSRYYFRIDY